MSKMRWQCEKDGCFNKKMRPKIEVFDDCFPGNIQMGDIDAIVEVNGHILIFDFKSYCGPLPVGQRIMFERITSLSDKIMVIAIHGNAETMECFAWMCIKNGVSTQWYQSSLDDIREKIKTWVTEVNPTWEMIIKQVLKDQLAMALGDKAALYPIRV